MYWLSYYINQVVLYYKIYKLYIYYIYSLDITIMDK